MSSIAPPRSQALILFGTVVLALAAGICNALSSMARGDPDRFSPDGVLQIGLLVLLVTTVASASAVVGKRWLNRPTAALLGSVGGGLSASLVSPIWGALGGLVIGLLVSLDLGRRAIRAVIAFVIGLLGAGLARHIYLDAGSDWLAASILTLVLTVTLQQVVFFAQLRKQVVLEQRSRSRWRGALTAIGLAVTVLLTLMFSWVGGWHAEMLRRMQGVQQRGGEVYLQWGSMTPYGWLPAPSAAYVSLDTPTHRDWNTVRALPPIMGFSISGEQTTDASLVEMPDMPSLSYLVINKSRITGRFLETCRLPSVASLSVRDAPVDDDAMKVIGRMGRLTRLDLARTRVTGKGLARLRGAPFLAGLNYSSDQADDDTLRAIADLPLTSLDLDCPQVTVDGLRHLAKFSGLRSLTIASPIDDRALRELRAITSLTRLYVYLEDLTPETVKELGQFPKTLRVTAFLPNGFTSDLPSLDQRLPPNVRVHTYNPADRPRW